MWKIYLKQIRYQLRENKFFSLVYILGTALSITMVMMILITLHIKVGNVGAENKRDRMLFVSFVGVENKGSRCIGTMSMKVIENCFYKLETPEAVCAITNRKEAVMNPRTHEEEKYLVTYTDEAFWKIFSFNSLEGRLFNDEDVKGKAMKAVISRSVARQLFGRTDVIGYPISIRWKTYQVCGVVDDVPPYLNNAYAQIWVPFTSSELAYHTGTNEMLGSMAVFLLQKHRSDQAMIKQELEHYVQEFNKSYKDDRLQLYGQPDTLMEKMLRSTSLSKVPDVSWRVMAYAVILLVLLVVPALNISGLIVSRMKKRQAEIGIRKVFGASTSGLVAQLMVENFVQLLLGGVLGLCLSVGLFQLFCRTLLVSEVSGLMWMRDAVYVDFWHLVSPVTAGCVVIACFLLNLFSALVPVWRTTRINIVHALKN